MSRPFACISAAAALLLVSAGASAVTTAIYSVNRFSGSYYDNAFPQLLTGEPTVAAINASIRQSLGVDTEPCKEGAGSWSDSLSAVRYVGGTFFGFTISTNAMCPGYAHDEVYDRSFNYDLTTGENVTLAAQMKDGDVSKLREAMIQDSRANPENCGGDLLNAEELIQPRVFQLSQYGFQVSTGLTSPTYRSCEFTTFVPYKDVEGALQPGSLAARLHAAAPPL